MKSHKASGFVVTIQGKNLLKILLVFLLLLFLIFSISGVMTSLNPEYRIKSSSINNAATNVNGNLLYQLIGFENHYFLQSLPEKEPMPNLSSLMFKASTNINFDDPRSLLGRELPAFSLFDGKIVVAGQGTNYTNMPIESSPPLEVLLSEKEASLKNTGEIVKTEETKTQNATLTTGDKKTVYVYFSHNRESFLPYLEGVTNPNRAYHSKINVTNIGDRLKERLEALGIGTTVDKTDIDANLKKKGWTFGKSYDESRNVVKAAMANNRDLNYFIDIHRDARRKKDTTITINGQAFAKLAFVVGAEHPNYEKNLRLASDIHKKLEENYPGLSRGIIEKKGAHTNGKFNQDLSANAMLLEFGGVDNTFEELNRSADAFAEVLADIYWQAEAVDQQTTVPAEES
ncbi:stage II sporulation protein P [Cytobacillus sp. FJAT-54145]|uniref:Stage II sporulation protein P n=1 Tax=Cytobacillus spartinae TaxID=3299023 RepID=A0ABW6KG31_9BACI